VEESDRDLTVRHYPSIRLDRLRKFAKNLSQDSQSAARNFNPRTPEYEAGMLTTRLRHSVGITETSHNDLASAKRKT
jgi:hypothetical protein